MILLTIAFVCAWNQVAGQFENGIAFNNVGKPPIPTVPPPTSSVVVSENCKCVIIGTCPIPPPTIDFRIVNNGGVFPCPPSFVLCCVSPPLPPPPSEPACGQRRISPTPQSVVGRASFGAYPWQAALLDKQLVFKGSGVLLDKMNVLTAAHKVTSFKSDPGSLLVRLGEWNSLVETEIFQYYQLAATKIVIHPSYNPNTLENDVAVVKLSKAVPIVDYPNINTACKPSLPVAAGQRCYVSGWGKNLFGNKGSYQSIMKEVDVKIVDNADCENRLRQTRLGRAYNFNGISFMCAGGEVGKDACQGDGGSPLVCDDGNGQWTVYGLVAWGIGCANPGVPGVYTNVLNFLPWINNAIAQT